MIQLADARRIIAAAEKKAEEIGQPMNVAVVDEGGNLIAFEPSTSRRKRPGPPEPSTSPRKISAQTPSLGTSSSAFTPPTTAKS